MTQLGIVIPVFNGWQQTRQCLDALRDSRHQDFEVFVVDHGSTDDTKPMLARDYPEVHHLLGDSSLWWAGATNLGVREVLQRGMPSVMLLNNDCYVTIDTIGTLMAHAGSRPQAVIAPVQRDQASGAYTSIAPRDLLLLGFPTLPERHVVSDQMRRQRLVPTRLISGGRGVVIPAVVFENIGLLDADQLPHYCSDHDFYFRCREQGVALQVAVDAEVTIDATRTSSAEGVGSLDWRQFRSSLTDIRSHRNIPHLKVLYRKHYPIRSLYLLGVGLNVGRYTAIYLVKRSLHKLTKRQSPTRDPADQK